MRTRKDGSAYTSVLFRVDGKQSSMSFGDHAKAVRFKDLVNQVGPAKALEVIDAAERTVSALTVEEWIGHHISHLTGVEQETIRPPSTEICSVATIQSPKPSRLRPDRVTGLQAAPSGFPADVGRRPLFVRTLDGRADALSVLADVASQREGESDVPDSHFLTFC